MKYSFKLIIIILFLLTTGCLNDNNLLGERQDIYSDPMLEYLNNDGRKIKLGKLITISNISQTDNGPKHVFSNASFKGLLSKAWEASVIKNGNISAPIITEKNIFVLDGYANLISYNLNGQKLWVTSLIPKTEVRQVSNYSGGLAVYKDRLFALTGYGEVVSLDISEGSVLWRQKFDSPFRGPPIIKNNRLYAISSTDEAIAITLGGRILWTLEGPTRPTVIGKGIAPASHGNKIFLPFSAGLLQVVRDSNGAEIWSQSFDNARQGDAQSIIGDFGGSPIIKSGRVFIVSSSGQLLAINSSNGRIIWDAPVGSQSTPLIVGGSIFVATSFGKIVRINEKNGRIIWSRLIGENKKNKYKFFGPTLAGNNLWITGTDGQLRKFDPENGKQIAHFNFRNPALYRPFAAHNKLIIITKSGKLIALN